MNATRARWTAAGITTLLAAAAVPFLASTFSAGRYDGEIIINLIGLALLTFVFAVPGGLALVLAAALAIQSRRIAHWMRVGLLFAAVAAGAATMLAFAAECVPYCRGTSAGLQLGLVLATPAGFGVGALLYATWRGIETGLRNAGRR